MKKIIALGLLCCVLVSSVQAQGRNRNIKKYPQYGIAYNVEVQRGTKIDSKVFLMNFDGSNARPMLTDKGTASVGAVGNGKLFFVSNRDTCEQCYFLYSCNYSGDSVQKVSDLQLEGPAISCRKGGKEIVGVGRIGSAVRHQLYLIDVKSGQFKQLTKDAAATYANPCFSPDGRRIAYLCRRNQAASAVAELFVMNENGTGNRQLTRSHANATVLMDVTGGVKWHPKENFVSYVATKDGKQSLFAASPDARRQWKLTDNTYAEGGHDWSADGKWLVLTSYEANSSQSQIRLMHWKNKDQRQITESTFKIQEAPLLFEK